MELRPTRLAPNTRPRVLLARLAAWLSPRLFGTFVAPMAVLYPRVPGLVIPQLLWLRYAERGIGLPRPIVST